MQISEVLCIWFYYFLRLGHAQFLHYFIKKDKKFFKKRFGVQFLLDVIRKYLSSDDLTNSDATKTVRITIIGIINYYIQKEINIQEMSALVNYIVAARHDFQVRNRFEIGINVSLSTSQWTCPQVILIFLSAIVFLFFGGGMSDGNPLMRTEHIDWIPIE